MASTIGTVLTVAGLAVAGYAGYELVTGGGLSSKSVGTNIGDAIGTAINALDAGVVAAAKAAIKRAGGSLIELGVGYVVLNSAGQVVGYLIKQGVRWVFSPKPPSGGGNPPPPPSAPPPSSVTPSQSTEAPTNNPFANWVGGLIKSGVKVPQWAWNHLHSLLLIGALPVATVGFLVSLARAAGQVVPPVLEALV